MKLADLRLREQVLPEDVEAVRRIVGSSGFFSPEESALAVELVRERLARGQASGYLFLFAEPSGGGAPGGAGPLGYSCFGPIPCTQASFDLYWIAVHRDARGGGLGRLLLSASEERIRELRGLRVYAETSSREQYAPTRAFYEHLGYRREATLEDFYAPGEGKVVYVKVLG